ncbi:LOW QUALITY PROTEIN: uncharacterized protein C21orf140 homolog [Porphyrio hochstetteri]
MQQFANPPLRHILCRGCFDAASERQCLVLRRLHLNAVFLGETNILKSLITGEKISQEASLCWQVWILVHTGSSQRWVPWRDKLLLRGDPTTHQQNSIFQELCDLYGKCIIVVKDKRQLVHVGAKDSEELEMGTLSTVPPVIYMSGIECCPEVARADGQKLLVPSSHSYLYPMDISWSSSEWFLISNRDFALRSIERTHFRCLFFSDLIGKGPEQMIPNKWKIAIKRVKRWENCYLDTLSAIGLPAIRLWRCFD